VATGAGGHVFPETVQVSSPSLLESMTLQPVAIREDDFESIVAWYKEKFNARELTQWNALPYIDPEVNSDAT